MSGNPNQPGFGNQGYPQQGELIMIAVQINLITTLGLRMLVNRKNEKSLGIGMQTKSDCNEFRKAIDSQHTV